MREWKHRHAEKTIDIEGHSPHNDGGLRKSARELPRASTHDSLTSRPGGGERASGLSVLVGPAEVGIYSLQTQEGGVPGLRVTSMRLLNCGVEAGMQNFPFLRSGE